MATVRVKTRVQLDRNNFEVVIGGAVKADIQRRTRNVKNRAKVLVDRRMNPGTAYSRTNRLKRAISDGIVGSRGSWTGIVYVNDNIAQSRDGFAYGLAVHDGTGVYGPRRRVIRAVTQPYMVFDPTGAYGQGARLVRRTTVRGQRPNRFLKDALPAAAA